VATEARACAARGEEKVVRVLGAGGGGLRAGGAAEKEQGGVGVQLEAASALACVRHTGSCPSRTPAWGEG
jgi:hypothetical protein